MTAAPQWEEVVGKTYVNDTDSVLYSRNPRLTLKPGDQVELTRDMISPSVRSWIRSGALAVA